MKGIRPAPPTEVDAERRRRAVERLAEAAQPTDVQHIGQAIQHAVAANA